jgi:predicted permease
VSNRRLEDGSPPRNARGGSPLLPSTFDFAGIFAPGTPIDIFIPWPPMDKTKPQGNTMKVVGRLKPGVTIGRAQAEFSALGKQLEKQHPERNAIVPRLAPLRQQVSGRARPALFVLACAVGIVMLIVCANLSNLQLARLGAREKEMATRAALGAGRFRLLRQMITESVTLSCFGAALGLILAMAGTRELAHLNAFNLPLLETVRIDGSALVFTLLAAVVTGVLFGLLPALHVQAVSPHEQLQDAGRGSSGGRRHACLRDGLVVAEIVFACILLVGAGLLIRSFLRVLDVNLGFQPERAAALRIDPSFRISSFAQQNVFIDRVLQGVRSVPGVVAAGITDVLPLRDDRSWGVVGKGQVYPRGHMPEAFVRVGSDGYFEAAGIRLRAGAAIHRKGSEIQRTGGGDQ